MAASNLFDKLVNDVRNSGLNFRLELTPFGAKISLKKSFIRNKDGNVLIPAPNQSPEVTIEALCHKNSILENKIETIQYGMNDTLQDLSAAQETIKVLQNKLDQHICSDMVQDVEPKFVVGKTGIFEKDKEELENEHHQDIRDHVNELRKSISQKNHVSGGTESSRFIVPVVPQPLADPKEKKCMLIHPWNQIPLERPAFSSSRPCQHNMQCVVRQPRSQPLPSITFLRHDVSKYHQHMITRASFHGCVRCFSVDNENYGCDDCAWLKWWLKWHGLRHGYPDIDPSIYKKYV